MIPLRDHNPTLRRPVLTYALVAANVLVFFAFTPVLGSPEEQQRFYLCHGAVPYEVTRGTTLAEAFEQDRLPAPLRPLGAFQSRVCPEKSVWVSLLSAMFLHGGLLHLGGNMLYLWVFGNNVEDRLGRARYLLFYLASGLVATYAQSFFEPSAVVPMVGASGAVAGVLGAYLLLYPRARVTTLGIFVVIIMTFEVPAVVLLGFWFLLQLLQGLGSVPGAGGVAYIAHVAGFVAGMLLILVMLPRSRAARRF